MQLSAFCKSPNEVAALTEHANHEVFCGLGHACVVQGSPQSLARPPDCGGQSRARAPRQYDALTKPPQQVCNVQPDADGGMDLVLQAVRASSAAARSGARHNTAQHSTLLPPGASAASHAVHLSQPLPVGHQAVNHSGSCAAADAAGLMPAFHSPDSKPHGHLAAASPRPPQPCHPTAAKAQVPHVPEPAPRLPPKSRATECVGRGERGPADGHLIDRLREVAGAGHAYETGRAASSRRAGDGVGATRGHTQRHTGPPAFAPPGSTRKPRGSRCGSRYVQTLHACAYSGRARHQEC